MVYIISHKTGSSNISPVKFGTLTVWRGTHVPTKLQAIWTIINDFTAFETF